MKTIQLTQEQVAIVDDEDYAMLSQWKWRAGGKRGKLYAIRTESGTQKTIWMHREVLGVRDESLDVDHKDRNRLNNKRENLRACSRGQNLLNRPATSRNKTGFKGVRLKTGGRYTVKRFEAIFRDKSLGYFEAAWKAALAYNSEAFLKCPDFALLNDLSGVFDGT